MRMEMDVVILWVDGSDPAWLAQKSEYAPPAVKGTDSKNRYRDWGLLPYWFRGIETFAPWVRKIHFVTWGHVPAFLNRNAEKLHIVRHDEFIPEEYLPTFSSHTIEMNIHRIGDLAEQFIYFNDDMFLLRPMEESDFFQDGLPCTYGGEIPWEFTGSVGVWEHAVANNMGVINKHFPKKQAVAAHGKKYRDKHYRSKDNLRTLMLQKLYPHYFTGFKNLHAPAAYCKQTFLDVWAAEPELLESTCRNRFRSASDVNQWVCLWWQVASGAFSPYVVDNLVTGISGDTIAMLCDTIENQRHDMICLNDPEEEVDFDALAQALKTAFETILPNKSQFEL